MYVYSTKETKKKNLPSQNVWGGERTEQGEGYREQGKGKRYVKDDWLRKRNKIYQYRCTQQHYSNWITLVVKVLFLMFVYSLFWS